MYMLYIFRAFCQIALQIFLSNSVVRQKSLLVSVFQNNSKVKEHFKNKKYNNIMIGVCSRELFETLPYCAFVLSHPV